MGGSSSVQEKRREAAVDEFLARPEGSGLRDDERPTLIILLAISLRVEHPTQQSNNPLSPHLNSPRRGTTNPRNHHETQ